MLKIAGKCIFQCKWMYLVKTTLQSDLRMKNVFQRGKLNPNNKNYLVKTIWLKLYYVIYSSTTLFIANLICLANIPTPDLIIYHLEYNLSASCFHCWSTDLTERKLPLQCIGPLLLPKENTHAMYYKRGGLRQRSIEFKSADCTYR